MFASDLEKSKYVVIESPLADNDAVRILASDLVGGISVRAGGAIRNEANEIYHRSAIGGLIHTQPDPALKNTNATLTPVEVISGLVITNSGVNLTLPAAASVISTITQPIDNDSINFSIINTDNTNASILLMGTGGTLVGSGTVATSGSATFRLTLNVTGTVYIVYRLN